MAGRLAACSTGRVTAGCVCTHSWAIESGRLYNVQVPELLVLFGLIMRCVHRLVSRDFYHVTSSLCRSGVLSSSVCAGQGTVCAGVCLAISLRLSGSANVLFIVCY